MTFYIFCSINYFCSVNFVIWNILWLNSCFYRELQFVSYQKKQRKLRTSHPSLENKIVLRQSIRYILKPQCHQSTKRSNPPRRFPASPIPSGATRKHEIVLDMLRFHRVLFVKQPPRDIQIYRTAVCNF